MGRTTSSTRHAQRPGALRARAAASALAGLSLALALGGCVGGNSPRSAFYQARGIGVEARPGSGAEITVVTRAPVGTIQETGVVARRFD